ncbi:secreted protein [Streptomyces coelicoflavus ZG0656]|nr:secreted protein [Streptomyces coelicoflavus ZG0656]
MPLAVRAAQGRAGLHGDRDTGTAGLHRPAVPTLIFHGPDDAVAPWHLSRRLADTHARLVSLHAVRDAPHGAMWNADPADYEETLRRFMTPLV